ncbi:DMT family transporter [Kiritimatiella glycovorans]|uniref:Putative inner membrane transporter yiJE n=1 Tax=Kiritimatiella glycovorans TaxID=1307763 RepID=A0A0G3ED90_9BACT|nr:EamA family transporter [Kiritimatiella glycovorans]AKJ63322.1 putative inner membrane transporter yiJE [Kiritimatiella glycovorans]
MAEVRAHRGAGKGLSPSGLSALLIGIALFSTIEVASKLMQTGGGVAGDHPFWLAFFRFTGSGLLLAPLGLRLLHSGGVTPGNRDALRFAGLGLLGITVMAAFFHSAITYLPANIAALVFSCNPVFVVLFAPLVLPERITPRRVIAVAVCLAGIAVLARDGTDGPSTVGLLLMVAALIAFAFYTVIARRLTPRYGALPVTAFAVLAGGIFLLPLAWVFEGLPPGNYGAADWLGIAYLAVFATALGYFLYFYGLGHVDAGIGSMAFFLKPVLAAVFAWFVLGEGLSPHEFAGGALILAGMAVALWRRKPRRT